LSFTVTVSGCTIDSLDSFENIEVDHGSAGRSS